MAENSKDPWMKGRHIRIAYTGRIDGWGRDLFLRDLAALAAELPLLMFFKKSKPGTNLVKSKPLPSCMFVS